MAILIYFCNELVTHLQICVKFIDCYAKVLYHSHDCNY
jgi:hypothetical protein